MRAAEPNSSSSAANVPGTGSPSMARWPIVRDVEKPSAPASIASLHDRAPSPRCRRAWRARCRRRAPPSRSARTAPCGTCAPTSMPNVGGVERVEVLGEGLPAPVDALGAARCRGCPRRPPSAPISHSSSPGRTGANPTPQLPMTTVVTPCQHDGVEQRVPGDLAVVVRVDVDEAGRDEQPGGVDGLGRVAVERRLRHVDDRRRP